MKKYLKLFRVKHYIKNLLVFIPLIFSKNLFDKTKMTGKYVRYPERSELNADINESLIVEFYNR